MVYQESCIEQGSLFSTNAALELSMISPRRAILFISIAAVLLAGPVTQAATDDGETLCLALGTTSDRPIGLRLELITEKHDAQPVALTTGGVPREDSSSLPTGESRSHLLLHCLLRC